MMARQVADAFVPGSSALRTRHSSDGQNRTPLLRPAPVGAALAAGWATLAGALPCAALAVLAWLMSPGGSAGWALRVGVDAWLLAHGVPIALPDGTVDLTPLGLTLLPFLLLCRAGAWVGRTSAVAQALHAAGGIAVLAVGYGGLAAFVAFLGHADGVEPDIIRAFVHGTLLAGLAGGAGIVRMSGHAGRMWRRVPEEVRAALYGGFAGLAALLSVGFLLLAASLLIHAGRALALTEKLAPGPLGMPLLLLVSLAYVPNAAVCAAAFALGPGFAFGTGTVVAPTGVAVGPLPVFPLLAALPGDAELGGWMLGVVAMPLLAGGVAGLAAVRRYPAYAIEHAALRGGLAGVVGGIWFTAIAALAYGSVGPGRLSHVGPLVVQVGVVAVSTLGIAGAVAVLAMRAGARWRSTRASQARRDD